jgi:hypothetical protein
LQRVAWPLFLVTLPPGLFAFVTLGCRQSTQPELV